MIRKVLGLVPAEYARLTPRLLLSIVCQALAQAVAYVLLVPVLQALFDDDLDRAWWWTLWLVLAVAAVVVFGYLQSVLGLRIGVGMQHGLQTRLGDQLNALPLGWFDDRHAGELSRVVVENVREVQGLIAYLLAKMLTGVLVPLGVAVGMLFVDWRISLAMLVAAPALFAVNLWANRSYAGADERMHEAAAEANARVLEFAQAQPVLRSSVRSARAIAPWTRPWRGSARRPRACWSRPCRDSSSSRWWCRRSSWCWSTWWWAGPPTAPSRPPRPSRSSR